MVELITLQGKWIRLTNKNGDFFVGKVCDYFYPEDNSPDFVEEALAIKNPVKNGDIKYSNSIAFNASDIVKIEVIDLKKMSYKMK